MKKLRQIVKGLMGKKQQQPPAEPSPPEEKSSTPGEWNIRVTDPRGVDLPAYSRSNFPNLKKAVEYGQEVYIKSERGKLRSTYIERAEKKKGGKK